MKQPTTTLAALLAAQLLLIAVVYWPGSPDAAIDRAPLLPDGLAKADQWRIEDGDDNSVVLKREGEKWLLPELGNLPANSDKVNRTLGKLADTNEGWPVASSDAARERFEVDEDSFQRRLSADTSGEELVTLLLGTSPGFRNVHVRNSTQQAIYSIPFNTYEVPAKADGWLDSSLLQIEEPTAISGADYQLSKSGEEWQSADDRQVDSDGIKSLLDALAYLQVNGIADSDAEARLADLDATMTLSVSDANGSYALSLYEVDESRYVRSDQYSQLFKVSSYDFDRFTDAEIEELFVSDEPAPEESDNGDSPEEAENSSE